MKTELQQKLRKLITKHNPSLKKLRLGAEVIIVDEEYKGEEESAYFIRVNDEDDGDIWADVVVKRPDVFGGLRNVALEGMYIHEIIGHSIELRHLLIALHNNIDEDEWMEADILSYVDNHKINIKTEFWEVKINLSIPLMENEEKVLQDLIDLLS